VKKIFKSHFDDDFVEEIITNSKFEFFSLKNVNNVVRMSIYAMTWFDRLMIHCLEPYHFNSHFDL